MDSSELDYVRFVSHCARFVAVPVRFGTSFQRAIHSNSTKFYELISVKFRSLPVDFQFDRPEPEVRISTGSSGVTGSDRNSGRLLKSRRIELAGQSGLVHSPELGSPIIPYLEKSRDSAIESNRPRKQPRANQGPERSCASA